MTPPPERPAATRRPSKPRIGAIRYLNALPLVADLERDDRLGPVRYAIPSVLAEQLRNGELDVALIPQVEACQDDAYVIVPGPCIACRGPVESILVFSPKPWDEIRTVGVDLSSRTSVQLLQVLFHHRTGRIPECVPVPPRLDPLRATGQSHLDAVLLIGDRALAEDTGEFPREDLGELWWNWTGLPFVFALWVGRDPVDPDTIEALQDVARTGTARRDQLADAFLLEHAEIVDRDRARRYLRDVIHYDLDDRALESLTRFHALRARAGLAEAGAWRPRFANASPSPREESR